MITSRAGRIAFLVAILTIFSGFAFASDIDRSRQLSVSSLDTPLFTLAGSVQTEGTANDIAIVGSYALIADGEDWLQVVDVSDPYSPDIVGWGMTFDNAYALTAIDDFVLIAIGGSGLQISNVADPTDPQLVSSLDTPGQALGVAVSGTIAFVADYTAGLHLIDISDTSHPVAIGTIDTPGYAHDVAVSGSHVLVADGICGLQIVDISVPEQPHIIATVDTPGYSRDIQIKGTTAYVADGTSNSVIVVDFTDASSPFINGVIRVGSNARSVYADHDIMYVTTSEAGVLVIDLDSTVGCTRLGRVDTPGEGKRIVPLHNWMLIADGSEGIQVTPRLVGMRKPG